MVDVAQLYGSSTGLGLVAKKARAASAVSKGPSPPAPKAVPTPPPPAPKAAPAPPTAPAPPPPAPKKAPSSESEDDSDGSVKAKWAYQGEAEDELSFPKGAMIKVIGKEDDGWWEGEYNGKTGFFPGNYVM